MPSQTPLLALYLRELQSNSARASVGCLGLRTAPARLRKLLYLYRLPVCNVRHLIRRYVCSHLKGKARADVYIRESRVIEFVSSINSKLYAITIFLHSNEESCSNNQICLVVTCHTYCLSPAHQELVGSAVSIVTESGALWSGFSIS